MTKKPIVLFWRALICSRHTMRTGKKIADALAIALEYRRLFSKIRS